MNKKVTYLLGAGASRGVLPIVNDIGSNLTGTAQMIEDILAEKKKNPVTSSDEIKNLEGIIKDFRWLASNEVHYDSVDTLARQLHLQGKIHDLKRLKYAISLLFTILQCQNEVSRRHNTLFISILRHGLNNILEFPEEIKILTWNYDAQVELAAMSNFEVSTFPEIQRHFAGYPRVEVSPIRKSPDIVHLNGIAGFYETDYNKAPKINDLFRNLNSNLKQIIESICFSYDANNWDTILMDHIFSFSWETKRYDKRMMEYANAIASETEILVVIGYSFPTFNIDTDRKIFGAFTDKLTDIYYQDPNPKTEEYLRRTYSINNRVNFHFEQTTGSFLTPTQLAAN